MADKSTLTAEHLRHLLDYSPASGVFTWRISPSPRVKPGDTAGTVNDRGYIKIKIGGKHIPAHRLAFLWMTGEEPTDQVDHINGIRSDNRWDNLRLATASQNQWNKAPQGNNSSGFPGVYWDKQKRKWRVQIKDHRRVIFLGYFECPEIAFKMWRSVAKTLRGEYYRPPSAA